MLFRDEMHAGMCKDAVVWWRHVDDEWKRGTTYSSKTTDV